MGIPDGLAVGQTRWWAFILKRICKSQEQGTIRVLGLLIPLVEDKSVLFKNVNPPIIEFLLLKPRDRLPAYKTTGTLNSLWTEGETAEVVLALYVDREISQKLNVNLLNVHSEPDKTYLYEIGLLTCELGITII